MSDISDAVSQQEIADSILDAPIVGVLRGPAPYTENTAPDDGDGPQESIYADPMKYFEEEYSDQETGIAATMKFGDAEIERRLAERGDRAETGREQAVQVQGSRQIAAQPQEQQEDSQPITPESVQEGIAALDRTIETFQLNDAPTAKSFADEFCAALGSTTYDAGVNVEVLGSTMAKTALSALNLYEMVKDNPGNIPPIPAESAKAFSYDVVKGLGIDPRTIDVDEQLLADTVLRGVLNFYDTFERYGGRVTDLSKLNDPQAAEMFLGNFFKALGSDQPVSRQTALKVADAFGNYLLGFIGKVSGINQRQAESRQGHGGRSNTGRGRGQRVPQRFKEAMKGTKPPRFKTNSGQGDPFDNETMDAYAQRTLRL